MEDVGDGRSDRAQVILIGGFLIAVGVLSVLLLVNGTGFSRTIATQDGGGDDFSSLEFTSGVKEAVSVAMAGNGTTPSNASVEFEEYLKRYERVTEDTLLESGVSINTTVNGSKITTAWMVGQRNNGTFVNARGNDTWVMVESIPSPQEENNIRGRFNLSVDGMKGIGPAFVVNGTNETEEFDDLNAANIPASDNNPDAWNLSMRINTSASGTGQNLTLNMTTLQNDSVGGFNLIIDDSEVKTVNVTGNKTVTVDIFNETVNGNPAPFPGTLVNPNESTSLKFERGSNGIGTYDFRFLNESVSGVSKSDLNMSSTGDARGPCTHPDGLPCRSANGTEKHIVGVVHNVSEGVVDVDYVGRSTSYTDTVGNMTLDAEDVNLDKIENVDGVASFDVEIVKDNSPVEEGGATDLEIEFNVTNTGTVNGTQDVLLNISGVGNASRTVFVEVGETNNSATFGGNFTLSTSAGDNGTYTAFLSSKNDTTNETTVDTETVSVDRSSPAGPAIPDSPVGFSVPSWDQVTRLTETAAEVFGR